MPRSAVLGITVGRGAASAIDLVSSYTPPVNSDPDSILHPASVNTWQVDLANTKLIMESAAGKEVTRRGILVVGESGIFTFDDVTFVQDQGCGAILVGESIVKQGDPCKGIKELLQLE